MKLQITNYELRIIKPVFNLCLSVFLCGIFSFVQAQNDGSQQNQTGKAGTFAIVNARIVTVSGGVIENGTLVIRNGKIEAVGATISVPSGAEQIDAKGLNVYPGMIDAGTNLGLAEVGQGAPATIDVAETGDMNANAKAILGINPHSSHVNVTRVNGITTVLSMPQGGVISGQSAIINLNGSTQNEMAVVPLFGLVINFPRITTAAGGFNPFGPQQPIEFSEALKRRDQRLEDLKKLFRDAENYARVQDAYAKDKNLPVPQTDLKTAALAPYARGEKPIIFTAERERDIRGVARFAADMKIKAIIMGGQEAWKAADELKKNNIAVIYTNIYSLPVRDDDAYDYLFEAPAKLQKTGVKFCISTGDGGAEVRDLPYHAGLAGAYGLPKEEALKSVTLYAAQILGIADKVGSIEVGKIANIVVTDGDILEPRTNVKYLFINGRMLPLTSRHTELYDSFKDRK
ncbi:MAG: amidohydrolase family protein [Acidobacteria bacterium]|jgi:imidazolonepropionase-like amidohydrolase|nr:amidohydrolase family protein [Acidobacteriota bacterium]